MATLTLTFKNSELPAAVQQAAGGLSGKPVGSGSLEPAAEAPDQTFDVEVGESVDGRTPVEIPLGYKTLSVSLPEGVDVEQESKDIISRTLNQHWRNAENRIARQAMLAGRAT